MAGPEMHNEGRVRQGPAVGNSIARLTPPIESASNTVRGFPLGRIVATSNARQIPQDDILRGLQRHQNQDWGIWTSPTGGKRSGTSGRSTNHFRPIAPQTKSCSGSSREADRAATTVLLPEDY